MVRRSFGIRGSGKSGRQTEWNSRVFQTDFALLAASTVILDSIAGVQFLAKRPLTITRTVGSLWVNSDQVSATESPFGALGMLVANDIAVASGVAGLPNPVTDAPSDLWFLYQSFAASGANSAAYNGSMFLQFDSRAQRKVEEGSTVAVLLANASATDGLKYILNYRILLKLH